MEDRGDSTCNIVISTEPSHHSKPIIFDPDFFVEKLRHEKPGVFLELVVSNLTRLIDLPGTEFAQLIGEEEPKLPTNHGFFRSFNFLKRKEKGVVFGAPLTEEGIAQVYQLIEYLYKHLHVEGLFRIPGNALRQQCLKEALNSGVDIDLDAGEFHPNDVATLLKIFLGELPDTLLSHRHYNAHLKIAGLMVFDTKGKRTVPDKERQIEALQLLFLLLPPVSRNLLKLLLDLLYHTAKQQDKNKMTASNLALMFAPQIFWPKNMVVADLQENITKLNNGVSFMIKHSQKLFRAPAYIRELARLQFTGSRVAVSKDDLDLLPVSNCPALLSVKVAKRTRLHSVLRREDTQQRTEEALQELFKHVSNMPDSAKKKKLVRQFNKSSAAGTPDGFASPRTKKHVRSRTFGGLIKRKVLGGQHVPDRTSQIPIAGAATLSCQHQAAQCKENLAQRPLELMSLHLSHNRSKSTDEILDEKPQESQRGNRMRLESAI
ncbi:rho GTPase-activating protein 19 isoform X2 [Amblyraja radiata]|uniref:rho GTPase-activating protein 19 isoform X2 n=1 Tax=Amblyraja radiata TaxID=386614 RepID=UPI00140306E3|nr:rho GTPase-activating protein 19 isoform X2 [Amblyraja radiata]